MGNKTGKNQENITNLNNTIISDLVLIESSLFRLEHFINEARNSIGLKHLQYRAKLADKLNNIDNLSNDIFQKNEYLKRKLNRTKRYSFLSQQLVFHFKACNKTLNDIILEEYFLNMNRKFNMEKKIKYLHLYNEFEIVETDQIPANCYNFIILPMSRNRIFYCCGMFEKKSFMKITNKIGNELSRKPIDPNNYYRQFLVYNETVVGLFDDSENQTNKVEVYDQYLNKLASKTLKPRIELWSIANDQVVLRTTDSYEYTIYNFNLDLRFTLNLSRIIDETGIKNSIFLTSLNTTQIYLYYAMLNFVRKIDKKTGTFLSDIEFENGIEIKSNNSIRMDTEQNFVIKQNSTNKIFCFNRDGKLLAENSFDLLKHFNLFDITRENDICFSDNLKRKVYFI